ncbi:MAG: DNA repair protein RecO [Slackia sp.]|nr:DNA repair protein RecO [Slackia sp.]
MGSATYSLRAIVLRKTKLGESDAILTFLAEDGRQVRAVAKGARKPTSPFASRLDIFSEVDMLLACGRNLDIVKEARLVDAHRGLTVDMEHAAAAAPMADLMARLCQPDLPSSKLFALTSAAFSHAERSDAAGALSICAAFMFKAFAFAGFRPSFRHCVACGTPLPFESMSHKRETVSFSAAEGGVVCSDCLLFSDTVRVPVEVLLWTDYLLMTSFSSIVDEGVPLRVSFEVLHLCQMWAHEHAGARLKSLEFLFACGLF